MDERTKKKYQTSRRTYVGKYGKARPETDLREKILTQCILSGIVLVVVLLVSLFDTGFTNGIRNGVNTVLSGDISIESLAGGFGGISESYAGMRDSLNTIFGGAPEDEYAVAGAYSEDENMNTPDIDEKNSPNVIAGGKNLEDQPSGRQAVGNDKLEAGGNIAADNIPEIIHNDSAAADMPAAGNQEPAAPDLPKVDSQDAAPDGQTESQINLIEEDFRIDEDILERINSRVDFYNTRTASQ